MFKGELLAIFTVAERGATIRSVEKIEAVSGCGLAGDRYFRPSGNSKPDTQVTLIEIEALEALAAEYQMTLQPQESRRNLLTRGVPLNHLVGRRFQVGDVQLFGIRLCEPCGYLERLTIQGVQKGLCHRGGLRAQILVGGMLEVGDAIGLVAD